MRTLVSKVDWRLLVYEDSVRAEFGCWRVLERVYGIMLEVYDQKA
jgi:hypothetical protein